MNQNTKSNIIIEKNAEISGQNKTAEEMIYSLKALY